MVVQKSAFSYQQSAVSKSYKLKADSWQLIFLLYNLRFRIPCSMPLFLP
jgi:hypothetical protein